MNQNTSNDSTTATATQTPRTGMLSALREDLRAKRAARQARRTMIRELAAYTSPADQADLDATLSRYDDDEVAEVRRLLSIARHQAA
jgi:hypothetical protein